MTDCVYAVMNDTGTVVNIVTAADADSEPMLRLLLPEAAAIVLATNATGPAYIGGDLVEGRFRMPRPYPSWVWDTQLWAWVAPIPYPEGGNGYIWDEESVSWVEIPPAPPEETDEETTAP